jgi:tRNA dimethylallyltransferase
MVITGPTGAGKSALAIELASRLRGGGEIVSCDSVQIYKSLDVGSGKVTTSERERVRHHMLDVREVEEECDAAAYYDAALECLDDIHARGKTAIVVGGSGMYLRWLVNGKPSAPKSTEESRRRAEADVSAAKERGGWKAAVVMLRDAGDAHSAETLSENDWYRLTRAYEIVTETGRDVRQFSSTPDARFDFRCFFLSVPRLDLYRRIDDRVESMVCDGMMEEAAWMLDRGIAPGGNTAARSIGYRQAMEYLDRLRSDRATLGEESLLAFLEETQKATRSYAKRQFTWFRGEPEGKYAWIDMSTDRESVVRDVLENFEREEHGGGRENLGNVSREVENELKRYKVDMKRLKNPIELRGVIDRIRRLL